MSIKICLDTPKKVLVLMSICTVLIGVLFLFYDLKGNLSYVITRRATIFFTMSLVSFAASVSTILFQTITQNRILSPAIMGFESLFILIQTILLFGWGEEGINRLDINLKFFIETGIMLTFSFALYFWLFGMKRNNVYLVLLVGIVCGSLFNSLSALMQRLLNPNEFAILQTRMFASFNTMPSTSLLITAFVISILVGSVVWRMNRLFDVLSLGQESATTLGIDYKKTVSLILILIASLVSVSTALVGPLTFFGFLVASITYQLIHSCQHRILLPAAFLIGIMVLTGGQFVLQHMMNLATTLTVVINFVGGILFLIFLLKRARK